MELLLIFFAFLTKQETNEGTFIINRSPVGFVLLVIDDDENLLLVYKLIVSCLLSGNFTFISFKKGLANLQKIVDFIAPFCHFKTVDVFAQDREGKLLDERLKSFIYHGNKHIGSVIECSEHRLFDAFHHLDGRLFDSKTVFKPKVVLNNTV